MKQNHISTADQHPAPISGHKNPKHALQTRSKWWRARLHLFWMAFGLFAASHCPAQIWNGDVFLSSQAQIDSFPLTHNHARYISGYLALQGDDITRLDSLQHMQAIGKSLYIDHCGILGNLIGLDSVEWIGSSLQITNNPLLKNVNGLGRIRSASFITIKNNANLQHLNGLQNLGDVTADPDYSSISIEECPELKHLGLRSLKTIKDMNIFRCGLESFDGLDSLESAENLYFSNLPHLKNVSGLKRLKKISGGLGFVLCDSLPTLDGMCAAADTFIDIGDRLWIIYCKQLRNLNGLNKIKSVNIEIIIAANDSLQTLEGLSNLDLAGNHYPNELNTYIFEDDSAYQFNCCDFNIVDNPSLVTLGLNSYAHGSLAIDRNANLQNIDGLDAYREGSIGCSKNPHLSDVSGAYGIQRAGVIWLQENHIDSLDGFDALKDFRQFYLIDSALQRCRALDGIDSTRGKVFISYPLYFPSSFQLHTRPMRLQSVKILNNARHLGSTTVSLDNLVYSIDFNEIPHTTPLFYAEIGKKAQTATQLNVSSEGRKITAELLPVCDSLIIFDTWYNEMDAYGDLDVSRYSTESYLGNSFSKVAKCGRVLVQEAGFIPSGFDQISEVRGVNVSRCNHLTTTNLFPNLKKIQKPFSFIQFGTMRIEENKKLTTLNGFENVTLLEGDLYIKNDSSLTDCRALCHLLTLPPANRVVDLEGTPFPCDTKPNITTWCDTLGMVAAHEPYAVLQFDLSPNPANTETLVEADATESGIRSITIVNAAGAIVQEQFFPQGYFKPYRLYTGDLPSGQYWVVIKAGAFQGVKGLSIFR